MVRPINDITNYVGYTRIENMNKFENVELLLICDEMNFRFLRILVEFTWPNVNVPLFSLADLSECQLVQVPDAVYHLMRHTELKTCDLSSNVIKKIPPKFSVKFSMLTGAAPTDFTLAHCATQLHAMKVTMNSSFG